MAAWNSSRQQQRATDKMKRTFSLLILVVLSVLQGQAQGTCSDTYLYYDNQYVAGGSYIGALSVQDCKDECSELDSCDGIGIKSGTECYLVLFVHSGTTWDTDWKRYQRPSSTCEGSCTDTFLYYNNQYVPGGTFVGVYSTANCKKECSQLSTCKGIGMRFGTECYLVLFDNCGTTSDTDWERYQRSTFSC